MQNNTAINETKQNENSETPKNEKLFGYGIVGIALSMFIPIIIIGTLYWFYTQEQKTFEESISNIITINDKQENSINSTLTIGKNNKNDIKELEKKTTSLETIGMNNKSDIKILQEKIIRLESSVKNLAELNSELLINLNNSIKMSEKFETELRELTNKHQDIINNISKDIKSYNKYYIIEKPLTPLPTKNTVTLPTAPLPTKNTVTPPTIPLPIKETRL